MHLRKNGYVGGAILMLPLIRKMRAHIEFEKFQARVLVDNDKTREFKRKTEQHPDKIYKFRYNHPVVEKMTAAGRSRDATE